MSFTSFETKRFCDFRLLFINNVVVYCFVFCFFYFMPEIVISSEFNKNKEVNGSNKEDVTYEENLKIEEELFELEKRIVGNGYNVNANDSMQLTIGGDIIIDQFYTSSGPLLQTPHHDKGSDNLFNQSRYDLLFDGKLPNNFTFGVTTSFLYTSLPGFNNRDSYNRSSRDERQDLDFYYRAEGTYKFNNAFNIMAGRFITPAGLFLANYSSSKKSISTYPQYLHSEILNPLYVSVTDGFQLFGVSSFDVLSKKIAFNYHLYGGTNSYDQGDFTTTATEKKLYVQYPNHIHAGLRLNLFSDSNLSNKAFSEADLKSNMVIKVKNDEGLALKKVNSFGLNYQYGKKDYAFHVVGIDFHYATDIANMFKSGSEDANAFSDNVENNDRLHLYFKVSGEYVRSFERSFGDYGTLGSSTDPLTFIGEAYQYSVTAPNYYLYSLALEKIEKHYVSRLDSDKETYYVTPSIVINENHELLARYDYLDLSIPNINNGKNKKIYTVGYIATMQKYLQVIFAISRHDYSAENMLPQEAVLLSESERQMKAKNPDFTSYSLSGILSF